MSYIFQVGTPYLQGKTTWPESPQLRMTASGIELAMFYRNPVDAEIQATRTGLAQFAWIDGGVHLGLLAFKLGELAWADCPYNPHVEALGYGLPDGLLEGEHLAVHLVLVDAATGLTRAMRMTTWPAAFVARVHEHCTLMLETPWDEAARDRDLERLYLSEVHELVAMRSVARCVGGQS